MATPIFMSTENGSDLSLLLLQAEDLVEQGNLEEALAVFKRIQSQDLSSSLRAHLEQRISQLEIELTKHDREALSVRGAPWICQACAREVNAQHAICPFCELGLIDGTVIEAVERVDNGRRVKRRLPAWVLVGGGAALTLTIVVLLGITGTLQRLLGSEASGSPILTSTEIVVDTSAGVPDGTPATPTSIPKSTPGSMALPSPTNLPIPTPTEATIIHSFEELAVLPRPPGSTHMSSLALSPDGQILARGDWAHDINLISTRTGEVTRELSAHTASIRGLAWSEDGRFLASGGGDGTIRVWKTSTWEVYRILGWDRHIKSDPSWSHFITFSPDSTMVASFTGEEGTLDRVLVQWDVVRGSVEFEIKNAWSFAWSPDGTQWATGAEDKALVQIWDAAEGQVIRELNVNMHPVDILAWSPDGGMLWTITNNGSAQLWDVSTGDHIRSIENVSSCASWSHDRLWLATRGDGGTIRVVDSSDGEVVSVFDGELDRLCLLKWSLDGKILVGGSEEDVRVWGIAEE